MISDTVTFMMTDVVGSTALWEAEPTAVAEAIALHDQIVQRIVEQGGGRLIKHRGEGDSTFSVFESPARAVTAAKTIQETLETSSWPTSKPIRIRIAVNSGSAEEREGDYYGIAVNRCARLRAIAHGRQIVVSSAVFEACQEDFEFKDLGHHRLKDLLAPEHVYELSRTDEAFPPLNSINALDHNLPIQLTAFMGREKELADLLESLQSSRLVTLTGFGGSGKTRLGLQAAAQLLRDPDAPVRFISLSELPKQSDIEIQVARAFGISIVDRDAGLGQIVEFLHDRKALLFIDNCEHVLESVARVVKQLLAGCPGVRVLATSREPLALSGERILEVGPLSLPNANETHPVAAAKSEAVALFLDRVRLRSAKFPLDGASAPLVCRLVRDLDGMPLAIEQAAARAASLGLSFVVDHLGRKLELLTSKDRDLEPRQRTVRATIEWSYELLDTREREAFCRLGTFQDVFILDDAVRVCGPNAVEEVESLAQKSMISRVHLSSHESGYRLLDTVKEFAREKQPEEASDAYDRHLDWCLASAGWIDQNLEGQDSAQAFHLLDRVYEDLASGLRRAIESQNPAALNLAFALRKPWLRRGPTKDGVILLDRALASIPTQDEYFGADCHNALGAMAMNSGMNEVAKLHLEQAAARFTKLNHPTKVAATSTNLGILFSMQGEFHAGKPYFLQAISAFQAAGDQVGAAKSALNLGRMMLDAGHTCEAAEPIREALTFFEGKDPMNEALSLINLAEAVLPQDARTAVQLLGRGFRIMREAPDHAQIGIALSLLSRYAISIGKLDDAAILFGAAEESMAEMRVEISSHLGREWHDLESHLKDHLAKDRFQMLVSKGRAFDVMSRTTFATEFCDAFRLA